MEFSWSAPRCHICSSDNLSRHRLMSSSESCIRFTEAGRILGHLVRHEETS